MSASTYPWIKDGQYVTPPATNYLAVTSPNGLYLNNGSSTTTVTPTSVTSTTFNGALSGNATTATSATTVAITEDNASTTALYPVFVSNNTGNLALKVDKTTTPLSYTPSSGTLASQNFYSSIGTVLSQLSNTGLQVVNAGTNNTTINSNQITCSQNSGSFVTTITPISVTATTFTGALTGNATTATNITGGAGGQILYQSVANTTAKLANGTAGQFLQSNGTTVAPSWVNQNLAATASGITVSTSTSGSDTLAVNFNNSFSSVTKYTVNFTNSNGAITRTISNYSLSGGVSGGQYTLVIELIIANNAGTNFIFNGTGLTTAPIPKTNFVTISTGSVNVGTRFIVLTFAFDGLNYFLSGSNFT